MRQATAAELRKNTAGIIRAPRRMPVAEAVHKYMRVPVGVGNSVEWDPNLAPYVVEPMNCLASREYDAVIFVGPGFTVREVGLMTDAGELYAVANCPSIDKPVGGVSVNMQFRLAVSDTSNITLNVATGDGLFLRIDQNLKEIKARGAEAQKTSRESIGVLDGTTQQRGLVQLNSALNSTSETQAATPAAVKIVMDNANARLAKDRNGADIPNVALFLQNLGLVETI
ncbi:tail fiber protein, partial [Citrobacter sp. Cpo102]|uniref:tail fiber protein n=1 Tax=Citrobacter sp. Cpo102 TaxID=2985142 RepID=UPI002578E3CB